MNPGERIKQVRNELGLSQSAFAAALGFPLHKVRDIERGHQKTTLEIATKLGDIFYTNPQWIMAGEGSMRLPITGTSHEQTHFSESSRPVHAAEHPTVYDQKTAAVIAQVPPELLPALHELLKSPDLQMLLKTLCNRPEEDILRTRVWVQKLISGQKTEEQAGDK